MADELLKTTELRDQMLARFREVTGNPEAANNLEIVPDPHGDQTNWTASLSIDRPTAEAWYETLGWAHGAHPQVSFD